MEQHAEGRISHDNLMAELIEGEKNGNHAIVDYEIPELQESLKTPELIEAFTMLHDAQEVSTYKKYNFKQSL